MSDITSCLSCGSGYCYGTAPGDRCCGTCTGNHETDTYHRYYPEETR